jgi:hypothetical protein
MPLLRSFEFGIAVVLPFLFAPQRTPARSSDQLSPKNGIKR